MTKEKLVNLGFEKQTLEDVVYFNQHGVHPVCWVLEFEVYSFSFTEEESFCRVSQTLTGDNIGRINDYEGVMLAVVHTGVQEKVTTQSIADQKQFIYNLLDK